MADSASGIGDPVARLGARAAAARARGSAAPVLISCTTPNDTSPSVASSRRHDRDRHAARLEPGRRGTGAVDRVDDEDRARLAERHEPAVLGVERDVAGGGEALLDHALGDLVDRHRGVAARRVADLDARGSGAEERYDRVVTDAATDTASASSSSELGAAGLTSARSSPS